VLIGSVDSYQSCFSWGEDTQSSFRFGPNPQAAERGMNEMCAIGTRSVVPLAKDVPQVCRHTSSCPFTSTG
jgi:hypothetical protein